MIDASARTTEVSLARLAGVTALFLVVAFFGFGPLLEMYYPLGHLGIAPDSQLRITSVLPGGAAESAGIRSGDRIDVHRLWAQRKQYDPALYYFPAPGKRIELPLIRDGSHRTITVTTREVDLESIYRVQSTISTILALIALTIGAWFVIARPSVMTWSLYLVLVSFNLNAPTSAEFLSPWGYWWVVWAELLCATLQALWLFIIVFAVRVPKNGVHGWMIWAQRAAVVLMPLQAAILVYPIVSWAFFGTLAINTAPLLYVFDTIGFGIALAALVQNFLTADGQDRQRMHWIVFGGILWGAFAVVLSLVENMPVYQNYTVTEFFGIAQSLAIAFVVYGLARSRLVDVRFVISRAVVVSLLTGSAILIFALLDWLFNKKLETTRLGAVTEFLVAIGLGISLDQLHKKVDVAVDRLFFRTRYIAERRLEKAAHAIVHADTVDVIREFLVDQPYAALNLGSAAFFEPNQSGDWELVHALGWPSGALALLQKHDALILYVEAEQSAVRIADIRWPALGVPTGTGRPSLAVPVLTRRSVRGIALYGEHANGADLDADEARAIGGLAEAASAAFDHVEAEQLRRDVESLRQQLAKR